MVDLWGIIHAFQFIQYAVIVCIVGGPGNEALHTYSVLKCRIQDATKLLERLRLGWTKGHDNMMVRLFQIYNHIYIDWHHEKHIASNDFNCIIFGTLRPGTMETNFFLVLFLTKTKNFRMCHPSSKTSFSLGTLWFFLYSKVSCSRKPRTRGCGCPWRPQLRSRMTCKIQLMYP